MQRSSGILLHISSLPSKYGIGTLGRCAYEFADFLSAAAQRFWQVLPLGQTGYCDSPYQSFSTYAGNPYFIDIELLASDGLVEIGFADSLDWGNESTRIDYGKIYENRMKVLEQAYKNGWQRYANEVSKFAGDNAWLADYALFVALKEHFAGRPWTMWPEGIRTRDPAEMERYRGELSGRIELHSFVQFLFFRQWTALKEYVKRLGISFIGDLPIYVAMDSADAWAEPAQFQLDSSGNPAFVAGVPPDYFSKTGQLWGNPLYDWEHMKADGFSWWMRRIAGAAKLYDAVRIDHFRGLASYWRVPYGAKTAETGEWEEGPGRAFLDAVSEHFPELTVIAEDLGFLTEDVQEILRYSGYPGMRVLQFAFDGDPQNSYLPHNYINNCICYTGTHDNDTLRGWCEKTTETQREFIRSYLGAYGELDGAILRAGVSSVADVFVAQMQDYLSKGDECRMNTPSTVGNNWQWRLAPGECSGELAGRIAALTELYGRA